LASDRQTTAAGSGAGPTSRGCRPLAPTKSAFSGAITIIGPKGVAEANVDLKELALRMGVMEPWETVEG
jgi:hypothetical protein